MSPAADPRRRAEGAPGTVFVRLRSVRVMVMAIVSVASLLLVAAAASADAEAFVAAQQSYRYRTEDFQSFTYTGAPITYAYDVGYGDGTYVMVGYGIGGTQTDIAVSTNGGVTWTAVNPAPSYPDYMYRVGFGEDGNGGPLWVAVGTRGNLWTSPDGLTWIRQAVPSNVATLQLYGADWSDGVWIVRTSTSGLALRSTDGATWTAISFAGLSSSYYGDSAGHDGVWVAGGSSGTKIARSTNDGVTWGTSGVSYPYSEGIFGVGHDGINTYVAVGDNGRIVRSSDGAIWTAASSPTSSDLFSVSYHPATHTWIASGVSRDVVISKDGGATWTTRTLPYSSTNHYGVATKPDLPEPGVDATITAIPDEVIADGTSESTIWFDLLAADGDSTVDRRAHTVEIIVEPAGLGTLSTVTNHDNGTYSAILTSTAPGTATITGKLDGADVTGTDTVEFVVLPPDPANSTLAATPVQVVADGSDAATVLLTILDTTGAPFTLGGNATTIETTHGTVAPTPPTDNGDGTYAAALTCAEPGTATLNATFEGENVTQTATVFCVAGPPDSDETQITADPTSITADGSSTSAITITLRDASGNAIDDSAHAVDVVTGGAHTCALMSDGGVRCWGRNVEGQLGDGSTTNSSIPVRVPGLSDASALTAGVFHTCALTSGEVLCWGNNTFGQLGDGTQDGRLSPTSTGITDAVAIGAGTFHTCAVLADGSAKCWGWNGDDQLGDGSGTDSADPVAVVGLSGPVSGVSGGTFHTCALLTDGTVECWGANMFGQLGNDDDTGTDSPTPVLALVSGPAAAVSAGNDHTCALLGDGAVECWGMNGAGQLGNETASAQEYAPVQVAGPLDATAVAAGAYSTCAALADGQAACWGMNSAGQLGDGGTTDSDVPVIVPGLSQVSTVAMRYHTCAVLDDGTTYCWALNDAGQVGDATTTERHSPSQVVGLRPAVSATLATDLGSLSPSPPTNNGDGTLTATLTSGTVVGTATITGTVDGAEVTDTAEVEFVAGPPAGSESTIAAAPAQIVADGADASTVTVQLTDANGNDLETGGATVCLATTAGTLSSSFGQDTCSDLRADDNLDGTYTATLTAGTTPTTATVTGIVDGQAITDDEDVEFVVGAADAGESGITADPTTVPGDGTTTSTVTVDLKDAFGNDIPTGGDVVCLTTNVGSFTPGDPGACGAGEIQAADAGDGTYTAQLSSTTFATATVEGFLLGGASIGTVQVTFYDPVVNSAPEPEPDSYDTLFGRTLTVDAPGVLGNDTDGQQDVSELTAHLVPGSGPTKGTLDLAQNGSFTYVPAGGAWGTDTFRYVANDGQEDSEEATVTIEIAPNVPPVAQPDFEDTPYQTELVVSAPGVLGNDTDHEDPTGATLEVAPASVGTSTTPGGGQLTLDSDGSFVYTPLAGFDGQDNFTYVASDGHADAPPVKVTIDVAANSPPVADDQDLSLMEEGSLAITLTASDPNPADDLTYSAVAWPDGLTGLPPDLTYTPAQDFCTPPSDPLGFDFIAEDPAGAADVGTVTITVTCVNDVPTAQGDGYIVQQPNGLSVAAPGLLGNDGDADQDPLAVVLVDPPAVGQLTLGSGGGFHYKAPGGFTGTTSFTYKASDGTDDSAVAQVTLDVLAPAPRNEERPAPRDDPSAPTGETQYRAEPGGRVTINVTWPRDGGDAVLVMDPMGRSLPGLVWRNGTVEMDGRTERVSRITFTAPTPDPDQTIVWRLVFAMVDGDAASAPHYVDVVVHRGNELPVPFVVARPQPAVAGTEVVLDGARSHDPDGHPLEFFWYQKEGTAVELLGAEGPTPSFTAPRPTGGTEETLTFVIVLSDPFGRTMWENITVVVVAPEPGPDTPQEGARVVRPPDARFRAMQRGDGAFLFRAEDHGAAAYHWDFGDGANATGREVYHQYTDAGDFTVRLTVQDEAGSGTATKDVDVAATEPVAQAQRGASAWWILLVGGIAVAVALAVVLYIVQRRQPQR